MVLQPLVTSLFSGLGRGELGFKKSSAPSLSVPDTPKLCAPPPRLCPSWGLPVPRLGVRKEKETRGVGKLGVVLGSVGSSCARVFTLPVFLLPGTGS